MHRLNPFATLSNRMTTLRSQGVRQWFNAPSARPKPKGKPAMNDHAHARPSRRRFAAFATTTLLALATLTALAVVPAPAMAAPPAADRFLKVYAPENESFAGARTLTQALADAETYDLITAKANTYKANI